jgi:Tripartite tricarboxylate transporter family receptor
VVGFFNTYRQLYRVTRYTLRDIAALGHGTGCEAQHPDRRGAERPSNPLIREAIGSGSSGAPRNTPAEIIDKLNREINTILADPKWKTRFAEVDAAMLAGSPADFGKLIAAETEKWGKVVKFAIINPNRRRPRVNP